MGNCEQQNYHDNEFELEMKKVENSQLNQNLVEFKNQAPSSKKAKLSKQKPILLEAVKNTLDQELGREKIHEEEIQQTPVPLPIYYVYKKKAYYEGEWYNGNPHGRGKLYFQNGAYFEGTFRYGDADCYDAILIYPDGSFKRGEVRDSRFNGKGIFRYKQNGMYYKGDWKDDQPHGDGQQSYEDGSYYKGKFVNGKKHGENCMFRWGNGKQYVGAFKDGFMEGEGTLTYKKGEYRGSFVKNLKVGDGVLKTQKGEYKGQFANGEMDGVGEFIWYDNKVYKGQFRNGKLHGKGIMYYPNGQSAKGIWIDGDNKELVEINVGKHK